MIRLCLAAVLVVYAHCEWERPHFFYYEPQNNTFIKSYINVSSDARSMSPTFATDQYGEKFRSHSSNVAQQDLVVLKLLNDKPDGYYVDLTAQHWDIDSNTYIMDNFNKWKGVCIEPNPIFLEGLLSNRRCAIFISPISKMNGEAAKFRYHINTGVTHEEVRSEVPLLERTMPSTTLTSVLNFIAAPTVMDYLSLDSDNTEPEVLLGLDHNKYTFRVITVHRPKEITHLLLLRYGYRFVSQLDDYGACLYLHGSLENFEPLSREYSRGDRVPMWHKEPRPYLLKVKE